MARSRSYRSQIAKVKRKLREQPARFLRALATEAHARVILRTPVDTGRARANWQLRIGPPASGVVEGTDPGGAATIAEGRAVLRALRYGESVSIVNNLPYIHALEHGHSRQAPSGMVAVTVAELRPLADAVAAALRSGE